MSNDDTRPTATERHLRDVWVDTPPKRTDAAFSHAVAAGVAQRRRRGFQWGAGLSLTAAAATAVFFVVTRTDVTVPPAFDGPTEQVANVVIDPARAARDYPRPQLAALSPQVLQALVDSPRAPVANIDALDATAYGASLLDDDDDDTDVASTADEDGAIALSDAELYTNDDTLEFVPMDFSDDDDASLLAMSDLFTIPANSPYDL